MKKFRAKVSGGFEIEMEVEALSIEEAESKFSDNLGNPIEVVAVTSLSVADLVEVTDEETSAEAEA